MKTSPRRESALLRRLRAAAALHREQSSFAARLVVDRRRVTLRGTRHSFTFAEIRALHRGLGSRGKIAQSDVPDNMLALLTALRASTVPVPS